LLRSLWRAPKIGRKQNKGFARLSGTRIHELRIYGTGLKEMFYMKKKELIIFHLLSVSLSKYTHPPEKL
jgi:hypothetical protein